MNDFDYDCLQKKRIARGAFHKKNGSRSHGCRLPHENLSKKELKKLNGEVFTLNMTNKLTWVDFKALPLSMQREYLKHLMDTFSVGLATIGRDLFELSDCTLPHYAAKMNLDLSGKPGGRIGAAALKSWNRWLSNEDKLAPTDDTPQTPGPVQTEEETPLLRAHDLDLSDYGKCDSVEADKTETGYRTNFYPTTDLSLTLRGTPDEILIALVGAFPKLLDPNRDYRFQLKVDTFTADRRIEW